VFYLDYPIAALRPAPYNPRTIDEPAFLALQHSIRTLGMVKPIIAGADGTIVAGHQRSRAAIAVGVQRAPVYVVKELNKLDEIRFNQLHNGTDLDTGDETVRVPANNVTGYFDVPWQHIQGNLKAKGKGLRAAIIELTTSYGPWGGIVASSSGECLSGAQYALACKIAHLPCRTFYVPDAVAAEVKAIFNQAYGEFYYENLPKMTFMQTFAQLHRLRAGKSERTPKGIISPNYENVYISNFRPGERILDFGCGQGDYVRLLQGRGVRIWGIEFFYRAAQMLNTQAVHAMADSLFETLRTHGRFDTVICEYVLNSTDRLAAERAVMTCLNAFCKPGGRIYASGRQYLDNTDYVDHTRQQANTQYQIAFLDKNGYTGKVRGGRWYYQKFHTDAQALDLATTYIGRDAKLSKPAGEHLFMISGVKQHELPERQVLEALEYEFNLPWPQGSVNRHHEAQEAWRAAVALERA